MTSAVLAAPVTAEQLLECWRARVSSRGLSFLATLWQPHEQEFARVARSAVAEVETPERLLSDRGARQAATAILKHCSITDVLAEAARRDGAR